MVSSLRNIFEQLEIHLFTVSSICFKISSKSEFRICEIVSKLYYFCNIGMHFNKDNI